MDSNEIYEKEDGWYYRQSNNVEWGPFESFQEAEDMALTPETSFEPIPDGNRSSGELEGSV